jgi:hypothetical protein
VFGTLLGVTIVAITQTLVSYNGGHLWMFTLVIGLAALLGIGANRALESVTDMLNRGRPPAFPPPPER